jgi:hypothetical protein
MTASRFHTLEVVGIHGRAELVWRRLPAEFGLERLDHSCSPPEHPEHQQLEAGQQQRVEHDVDGQPAAAYRARDGTDHLVNVDRTPEGRWCVLDAVADCLIIVETLTGHDDRRAQVRALALDYAGEQQAFQVGLRAHDPLPERRTLL